MTDLLTDQILDLAFNPLEKRDAHGRWTRGGLLKPGDTAKVGGKVAMIDGRIGTIKAIGPPAVPRGQVHVVVDDGKTVPSGFNYALAFLGLKEPIGPSGVLPQSQRFGGTPHQAERERLARRLKAMGHGPETIRSMLRQNRSVVASDVRRAVIDKSPVIPWTPIAELRKKQHENRRAALQTWTVDEQGKIIRHAHPGVHGQGLMADLPGKMGVGTSTENREARRAARQLKRDIAAAVHIPSQHWKFYRSEFGDITVTKPKVGDKARLSLGAAGNQVGTVISVGGGHAVIDSGDDDMRYLVDWRNGGRVIRKDPLSQVAPGARPGSSRPYGLDVSASPEFPSPGVSTVRRQGKKAMADRNRYAGMKFRPLAGQKGKLVAFDNNANPDKPWLIYSADGSPDHWVSDAELADLEAPLSPPGVMVAPGVKQYLLPGMPAAPDDNPLLARLKKITPDELETGEVEYPHQGIQGSVEIVTLSDGTKVVHKQYNSGYEDMADADVLTSKISQVVGAGAPPVAEMGGPGSGEIVMGFVDGEMAEDYPDYGELYNTPQGEKIGLLDYLDGNGDRHDENWMVTPDDIPVPIDNGGFLFGNDTSSDFWDGYKGDQAEYDQINEGLVSLEPEFARMGHLTWYRDMMSRWMDVAPEPYSYASDLLGIELTGSHGHHIPGTPFVYRHGWKEITPGPAPPAFEKLAQDSKSLHSRPDGQYTAQRLAMHRRMIARAMEGHAPEAHPRAIFLGGGIAAGKSTIKDRFGNPGVVVAADELMKQLPEYQQMLAADDPMASTFNHREASDIADKLQDAAVARRATFTLDGTGDRSAQVMQERVDAVHAAGYEAVGEYVTTDLDETIRRAKIRAEKTGRMVPEPAIRAIHASVSKIFAQLAAQDVFDKAELWDNNGRNPRLVGRKNPGGYFSIQDPGAWQKFSKAGEPAGAR